MITSLRLQHFRSYQDGSFEFEPNVNIIVGPNASGKTNLLEAILVVARGSSFRAKDSELVMFDEDWFRLEAITPDQTRIVKVVLEERAKKTFNIDDQNFTRLQAARQLPVVVFEPGHLQLLSGSPELRREYIDTLLEQLVVGYGSLLRQYKRSVAQRNALLKSGPGAQSQLFAWDIRVSELGEQVVGERLKLIEELNEQLDYVYSELAHQKSRLFLRYSSKISTTHYASSLLKKLEADHQLDMLRGYTGSGPHRDDIVVILNDQPQQHTASRGESRTIVIALKALELTMLKEKHDKKPIVLLDDVFSELDGARRKALTGFLKDYQTFITTTDADMVIDHFKDANVIALSGDNS